VRKVLELEIQRISHPLRGGVGKTFSCRAADCVVSGASYRSVISSVAQRREKSAVRFLALEDSK
jgi:hypothetical protein